jgi:PKD repeat protein
MAQTATTNILQSDANNIKFQLNTNGGYPVNMNIKTVISPLHLDYNGVSIPFNQTADGIQFTSVGNGTYTLTRSVPTPPVANFTANVTEGSAPLTVQFNDTSTNNPTGWTWNFGDGANSTEQNPEHTFNVEGLYTVNLTVANVNGTNSTSAIINVTKNLVFPGYTNPPTDPDHDGRYEDINGNVIMDFDDVVVYYDNMDWIGENANVAFFDYNNNNLIDFDDVVKLYDML